MAPGKCHHSKSLLSSPSAHLVPGLKHILMHRGQHIHSHLTFSLLDNVQSQNSIHISTFVELRGTRRWIPWHLACSPWLKFGKEKKKPPKPSSMAAGRQAWGKAWGSVSTWGKLAEVGCTLTDLGAGDHGYHLWGCGTSKPKAGSKQNQRYVTLYTHILRLPDTTVNKKIKSCSKAQLPYQDITWMTKTMNFLWTTSSSPKKVTP